MIAAERLLAATDATWPAARYLREGPWLLREGLGGGQRVSAATVATTAGADAVTAAEIDTACAAMQAMSQPRLFQIRAGDQALDDLLAARGFAVVDPVTLYAGSVADLAQTPPPRVTAFCVWEPLAIQIEIWESAGITAARRAVMDRAEGPKTALLGRLNDHPGGAGFAALDRDIAMVHALEVLPHQRGQGMAGHLMRQAAIWARDAGAQHLAVAVTQANTAGNALYASLGMVVVGQYHYRKHKEDT